MTFRSSFATSALLCAFALNSACCAQQVIFSDTTPAAAAIVHQLDAATGTVRVAMFSFTDRTLACALTNAAGRGIDVRVVADASQAAGGGSSVPWLQLQLGTNRVQLLRGRTASGIMHHKFCIIDDRIVLTGSYNWTLRAEHDNWENFLIVTNLTLARQFAAEFATMKGQP